MSRRAGTILGILGASAAALLAPPGGDLWGALAAAPSLLDPGFAGTWLWQAVYASMGMAGIGLLRTVVAALMALTVFRSGSGFVARLGCALALALLLPWGPGALFFPLLALALWLAPRRPSLAFGLCVLWPCLNGTFLWGGLLTALGASSVPGRRSWVFAAAPLLNPVALGGLVTGQAFVALAASLAGHPGFATPSPWTPAFGLTALWSLAAMALSWREGRALGTAALATAAAVVVRPLAALPPLLCARAPRDGEAAHANPVLLPALLTLPLALWLSLAPGPVALPEGAASAVASLPRGGWSLQTELEWRAPLVLRLNGDRPGGAGPERIAPPLETAALRAFRRRYPTGLRPPFEGMPRPEGDLLLLRPRYPDLPYPQRLQPGWSLVAAGPDYALFARGTPALSPWLSTRRLAFYSPFSPPPDAPQDRLKALGEARRLLEREPDFLQALRDAGRMETDFQMGPDAAAHLRRALAIAPRDAKLWNDLGAALQIAGDDKGALDAYARSVALDGAELLPRFNLASLLAQMKKPEEAERILEAVVAQRPRAYIAYRRLAQVYMSEGKVNEAKEILGQIPLEMRMPEDAEIVTVPSPRG